MQAHPFAEIFPPMSPDEYRELSSDIAKNGLIEPITLYQGMILDGRNRHCVCHGLDIKVKTVEFEPKEGLLPFKSADEQALDFVISKNLHRRHLEVGQKAMIATEMLPHLEAINKVKMHAGIKPKQNGYSTKVQDPPQNSAEGNASRNARESTAQAGAAVGVSRESVRKAARIASEAPELACKVKAGAMTLNAATKQLGALNGKPAKPLNIEKHRKKILALLEKTPPEYYVLVDDDIQEWQNDR